MPGATLDEAVGEASGRGADVEAELSGDVDPERVEPVLELDPAPRDVSLAFEDLDLLVQGDLLARPECDRPVLAELDLPGPDRPGRRGPGGEGAPLGKEQVKYRKVRVEPSDDA